MRNRGDHEELWEIIGNCRKSWEIMSNHVRKSCEIVGDRVKPSEIMVHHENHEKSRYIMRYRKQSMGNREQS